MAVKDVKKYYYRMLAQYTEEKENLKDYEKAFEDGHVTEEQLASVKESIAQLKANYERLSYVMFLLDSPKRDSKKAKYNKQRKKQIAEFEAAGATEEQVAEENERLMREIDAELDRLASK